MDLHPSSTVSLLRKIPILAVVLLLVGATYIDGILLQINDEIITLSDFRIRVVHTFSSEDLNSEKGPDLVNKLYADLLKEKLVTARAAEQGFVPDRESIEMAKKRLMEKNQITSEEEFEKAIIASGMTMEEIETKLSADMIMDQVLYSEVYTQRDITDWELENFYKEHADRYMIPETYNISLIVVLKEKHPGEDLDKAVKLIQAKFDEGGDFAEIATELTEGPGKERGGDLGNIKYKDLAPQMVEAIKGFKPGDFSGAIEQPFGYQWVKLNSINESYLPELDEVRGRVMNSFMEEKYSDKLDTFIEDLKKRYYIVEHKELLGDLLEQ